VTDRQITILGSGGAGHAGRGRVRAMTDTTERGQAAERPAAEMIEIDRRALFDGGYEDAGGEGGEYVSALRLTESALRPGPDGRWLEVSLVTPGRAAQVETCAIEITAYGRAEEPESTTGRIDLSMRDLPRLLRAMERLVSRARRVGLLAPAPDTARE
jgi:hypothetical protein